MKPFRSFLGLMGVITMAGTACAADTAPLPVPDFGKIVDMAGAQERPDPKLHYRVIFAITKAAASPDKPNPSLDRVARFVNLLAHYGVPKDHRTIFAIVSGAATTIVRKPTVEGQVTPDTKLIEELTAAGVQVAVCSQAAHGHDLTINDLLPTVRMDVSAITTIAGLQARGYAYLPD
jgi:intracellular sulfur oxidation DsrE/DsrF family protein